MRNGHQSSRQAQAYVMMASTSIAQMILESNYSWGNADSNVAPAHGTVENQNK